VPAKLGLLDGVPACTDLVSKPWVVAAGVEVLNQPFFAKGNVATAGGCLASHYLAGWIIARLEGSEAPKAPCTTSRRSARRRSTSHAPCATSRPTFARGSRSCKNVRNGEWLGLVLCCRRRAEGDSVRQIP
jgi:hypothetical protein